MKKRYIVGTTIIVLLLVISLFFPSNITYAEELTLEPTEGKVFCDIDIDDDFDDSKIIVVIDKKTSEINKEYSLDFFNCQNIEKIIDLTHIDKGNDLKLLDVDNFHQILSLSLKEKSKEKVIEATQQIIMVDEVLSAEPNCYSEIESLNPYCYSQWSMTGTYGIEGDKANKITKSDSSIRVGIIDSGIASHSDLTISTGWDFYNNNSTTNDDTLGHGTHVAGIVSTIAPNATIIPLQVADNNNKFDNTAVLYAISWCINNNIEIINYSGGGTNHKICLQMAISNYQGLFVCSAGNSNANTDTNPHYPSEYSNENNPSYSSYSSRVISVGSIDSNGEKSDYSNFGANTVSIYAPGGRIFSTFPIDKCLDYEIVLSNKGYKRKCECRYSSNSWIQTSTHYIDEYHYMNGTSMATPYVAGVAALLLSLDSTLTPAQVKDIIINQADNLYITVPNQNNPVLVKKLNAFSAVSYIAFDTNSTGETITGLNFVPNGELELPSQINGTTITTLSNYLFNSYSNLTKITIPDSIVNLGTNTFGYCSNLEEVILSNQLTTITSNVFENCVSLVDITLPSTITTISSSAFKNCTSLESINLPSSITHIGNDAFYGCTSLEEITIPASLSYIGNYIFSGCSSLEDVTITNGLTTIGVGMFYNCCSLESITIPESVAFINSYAFEYSAYLSEIFIKRESSIAILGTSAFDFTGSNKNIYVHYSVYDDYNSYYSGLSNYFRRAYYENGNTYSVIETSISGSNYISIMSYLAYTGGSYGYTNYAIISKPQEGYYYFSRFTIDVEGILEDYNISSSSLVDCTFNIISSLHGFGVDYEWGIISNSYYVLSNGKLSFSIINNISSNNVFDLLPNSITSNTLTFYASSVTLKVYVKGTLIN